MLIVPWIWHTQNYTGVDGGVNLGIGPQQIAENRRTLYAWYTKWRSDSPGVSKQGSFWQSKVCCWQHPVGLLKAVETFRFGYGPPRKHFAGIRQVRCRRKVKTELFCW